ncbi:MAG: pyridoxamine 5'-phosphate oxidase family protein [Sphaerochaetaceae bacterium]|nr:pyridoxamine 5'-phosphate oxidase family protein [Sphaerochaetaceae bacterium]
MNRIVEELKKAKVFYIATTDEEGKPQVRPFGSVTEIDGEVFICSNNRKEFYRQVMNNPEIAICGMYEDRWVRVWGKAVRVDDDKARSAMLKDPTGPSSLYRVGDGLFEVFRIENPKGMLFSFTSEPVFL